MDATSQTILSSPPGHFSIELHAWRSGESCTFATFIYEKARGRLLRHFTGSDENEVIRQALGI